MENDQKNRNTEGSEVAKKGYGPTEDDGKTTKEENRSTLKGWEELDDQTERTQGTTTSANDDE